MTDGRDNLLEAMNLEILVGELHPDVDHLQAEHAVKLESSNDRRLWIACAPMKWVAPGQWAANHQHHGEARVTVLMTAM